MIKRIVRHGLLALVVIGLWAAGSLVMQWSTAQSANDDEPGEPTSQAPAEPDDDGDDTSKDAARGVVDLDLGVQLSAHHDGRTKYADQVMTHLQDAGAGWIRVDVGWSTLQSRGPGKFDQWYVDIIDSVLDDAQEHDLKVILMLWQTPSWASPAGTQNAPPTKVGDYAAAVRQAAQRWGDRVDAWEIWNEPNLDAFFAGEDAAAYTKLLCAAYPAVKKYDDAPVLFGGIMYNDAKWLTQAYEAGAKGCFDALATHPYIGPSDAAPDTPSVGAVWRLTSTPAMRKVMKARGDGDKKIWITELGWSTGTENDGNEWDRPVTARKQAQFLRQAVRLIRDDYPYVGPIIWYRDVDGPSKLYQDGFGLLHANLTDKPAMKAFRAAVRGR